MRRSLTRAERVRKREEIRVLFTSARPLKVPGAMLRIARNGLGYSRLLASPGRRFGNSVQRNYIKRVSRELFRNLKPHIAPGFDLAIIFYSGEYTFQDRKNQLVALLHSAAILRQLKPEQGLGPASKPES